ncbi:MAG: HD domain-containing protein [Clostridia bacterium]|nr:HD domain-containing protein [Clostridia bacterium]
MREFINFLLNDYEVVNVYEKIDKHNKFPSNHGMKHILGVVELSNKIIPLLKLSQRESLILQTALILHDIGQVDGRENHGYKSMLFAKNYLPSKNIFDESELNMIYSAIETHDECFDYSILQNKFSWLVNMIDKLDFSKNRLEKNYKERFDYSVYEDIERLDFYLENKTFKIVIVKTEKPKIINVKKLFERNLFTKSMLTFKLFCEKFSLEPKVYLNDEEIDLNLINKNVIMAT